jgi:hypothetical protein
MTAPTVILAAALAGMLATPAAAERLSVAAPEAMREYADQAGYILASISICGGDAAEEAYFRELARDTLVQLGADEADIGFLDHYMAESAEASKPRKRECHEENSVPLASRLFEHRHAIEKALQTR